MDESWKQGSRSGRQHTSLRQQLQLAMRGADGAEKKTSKWARLKTAGQTAGDHSRANT